MAGELVAALAPVAAGAVDKLPKRSASSVTAHDGRPERARGIEST